MSCRDQDLSGCNELKVVEYTIVSVDPYIDDCDRILAGPETIAISDEMTDSDFTAYVIALYVQGEHKPIRQCDQQYLRVCWCVQCRLVMPCPDYEKQQVEALRQIAHRLPAPDGDENGGNGGPPAKSSKSKK